MFYVAIDFILIVFLYNFAFFVCEKLTTKNEKRTFGYFGCLSLNVYFYLRLRAASISCLLYVWVVSLSPSLSFAACLQHMLVLEEVPITTLATVFSTDGLQDVIVRGSPSASPIT